MSDTTQQHRVPDESADEWSNDGRRGSRAALTVRGLVEGSVGVWVGLVLIVLGFLTILRAWSKVAQLLDLTLQMPYVLSGGFTGLGLIVVGMGVADLSVRRRDGLERRAQLSELREILVELRSGVEAGR